MSGGLHWLADVEIEDVAMSWQKMSAATKDAIVIFGVLVVVTLGVFIWAAFIRRRRRRKRVHHYPRSRPESISSEAKPAGESSNAEASGSGSRKKRRRRREHRPKNPTLAETGGLPPMREDGAEDRLG